VPASLPSGVSAGDALRPRRVGRGPDQRLLEFPDH
jgi:hypothetical protein